MLKLKYTYLDLPQKFYSKVAPSPVKNPQLVVYNEDLAEELGLPEIWSDRLQVLSGNKLLSDGASIAQAYSGHQFGNFVPLLGDGRAILLGEKEDINGILKDIQLKGSGPTDYSRNGDGRATLASVLREFIVSEGMHYLNIPTTRSLAAIKNDNIIGRQDGYHPGGVLTRVATSHIRVGTFQFANYHVDTEGVKALADYAINRHFPSLENASEKYLQFFRGVLEAQASLIAKWLSVGFIHGVMNTDNMTISGETIDYGPCAFMDEYRSDECFSFIDQFGRYAYKNQPNIAAWNLSVFAGSLIPLIDSDKTKAISLLEQQLVRFPEVYEKNWLRQMSLKLLTNNTQLIEDFLNILQKHQLDFTLSFRSLINVVGGECEGSLKYYNEKIKDIEEFKDWCSKWQKQIEQIDAAPKMLKEANPLIIPRNHIVERIITNCELKDDYSELNAFLLALKTPFDYSTDKSRFIDPPATSERIKYTFCGT